MARCRFGAWGLAFVLLGSAPVSSAADSPLSDAAERSDRAGVRALLEQRVDVNQAQVDGMTALHWAADAWESELSGGSPLLEIVDLHVAYGRLEVVHGISLTFEPGAFKA